MMAEEIQIERVAAVRQKSHDATHLVHESGRAIRRKTHNFVFVPIVRKAKVLREALVEDSQRVGEIHLSFNLQGPIVTDGPGTAGKVAEAVDGDRYGF